MSLKSLLLVGLAATALAGAAQAQTAPPPESTAHSILRELLAIDTTYEKGTVAAVEALSARFLAAGFPGTDMVVVANPANPSQSNLVVRLKGQR